MSRIASCNFHFKVYVKVDEIELHKFTLYTFINSYAKLCVWIEGKLENRVEVI